MTQTVRKAQVVVVGAGPAGLAAAVRASEAGCTTLLLDREPRPGGQIWRPSTDAPKKSDPATPWLERLEATGAELVSGSTVVWGEAHGGGVSLLAETPGGPCRLEAEQLILATGAHELFLPFPGWTLPGVFGAGGLQALIKGGWPVEGRRVVVAGSGPLLLVVAAELRRRGARVVGLAEQAPRRRLAGLLPAVLRRPAKLLQLGSLGRELRGSPRHHATWPERVEGDGRVESVTLRSAGGRSHELAADLLACGFGLVPELRLARLLGCAIDDASAGGRVRVDDEQRTTVPRVFCAGEPTGIGGVDLALAEGELAGLAAARSAGLGGRSDAAVRRLLRRRLIRRREGHRRFASALEKAFSLRPELFALAADDTVVCRCEDVRWLALRHASDARQAKLQHRCGMGPCQGRICGPALERLKGWPGGTTPRPPLLPSSVGLWALACTEADESRA